MDIAGASIGTSCPVQDTLPSRRRNAVTGPWLAGQPPYLCQRLGVVFAGVEACRESGMRLMIAALATFLCAALPQAAAQSSLTKPNNDASLRGHGTPNFGGSFLYRRQSYPDEPRRG